MPGAAPRDEPARPPCGASRAGDLLRALLPATLALALATTLPAREPTGTSDLHNLFERSANVISGSEPHGDGMRCVHIPTAYKGLTSEEVEQLAKTYRECEAPFDTHCFHGKYRGPAAAEIGRIVLDGISREQAIAEMRQ